MKNKTIYIRIKRKRTRYSTCTGNKSTGNNVAGLDTTGINPTISLVHTL